MSGATYRIEVTHDPHAEVLMWDAKVYRLSDDSRAAVLYGRTADQAEAEAREWIAKEHAPTEERRVVFVDESGDDVAMHSVKA